MPSEVTAARSAPKALVSDWSEIAHAYLGGETTDALQYVIQLAAAACHAEAAALVAIRETRSKHSPPLESATTPCSRRN